LIMNVQHIKYFLAACQYKNISRAAEKINVSQSSVSAAIKKLEKRYGVPLIKRQKIGFELTEEGEVFYYLYDNVIIKNVSCDVFVDEDGNISENNLSVTVAGNDWDGKEHTARFFANISCSDIGKTKPDRFDTENTPNTRKESEQYAERIKELERLIESEKTTDEERAQYENELKRKKQDMEQHYKSGTIETAISEKHMKEE